jgi:lipopolysaccharide/colanic/teichoic acid biosynthesis glycosyltransferase
MIRGIFDILVSVLCLLFIIPFTPFIAAAILIEDGGPVFIKLPRVSKGKVVGIYKFRSMVRGAKEMKKDLEHLNERNDGPFFKIKNDPRLTKTGKFLRKLRVDEFPQFLNVLKGELSVVGPRAHEVEEVEKYPPEYKFLIDAKAGVTGLSQVSGASSLPYKKELELDSYYVAHRSLWMDIKIISKSIWVFFSDPTGV